MSYPRISRGPMAADVLQRDFTQIHNRLFRDPRLSFKAKGIFGLISTHRDGYGVSAEWIADASTDGVSAVKTGLRELEAYGYLERRQETRPDGTRGAMTYAITDMPSSEPPVENRLPDVTCEDTENRRSEPLGENPPADEPPAVDRMPKKISSNKTIEENTTPLPPVDNAPAAGADVDEVGGKPSNNDNGNDDPATAFVDGLPFGGQMPNRSTRERLIARAREAYAAGWTPGALQRHLTDDTRSAKSLVAVYLHRLADLPDPRAVAASVAADATYTPPTYAVPAAPDAVPPNEVLAAARAAIRAQRGEHARGRDHRPYIPTN
ncbi:hypothetical protein ACFVJK_30390 [Streptomyces sp. NPDC127172]|uniref:hypothetical protein n=1 Tax=Streptomyces sp. NPDC127172 TaxID=3345382 RepID=UPI003626DBAD